MKLLLVIFLFYINYVICVNQKYAVKSFPKKVKPYGAGKILINSGKYNKTRGSSTPAGNDYYTVFQIVGNARVIHGVPDSPYFPVDQTLEQKSRVKKVLPDYIWSRHKRSADDDAKKEETSDPNSANIKEQSTATEKEQSETEKPVAKNETPKLKSNDKEKPKDEEKEVAKVDDKGQVNQTEAKPPSKDDKSEKKSKTALRNQSKSTRKPKSKPAARQPSKKTNGTSSKTRSRGKVSGRNGTAVKKSKQSAKRQGKPKSKNKRNKKNAPRQSKGRQSAKRSKTAKKQSERKGNSTDVKILKDTRRLTSAREALVEEYPYVVSIQKDEEHWCAGALLNPRLVITTANCIWNYTRF